MLRLYAELIWKNYCGYGGTYYEYGGEAKNSDEAMEICSKWYDEDYKENKDFRLFLFKDKDGNIVEEFYIGGDVNDNVDSN